MFYIHQSTGHDGFLVFHVS